ncbi:hypothetical protein BGX34_010328 [Mortierella sp. NVP85]|nr:hypothetical protein BGX34_010328 [Mortierella sp. NVP85]
MSRNVSFEDPLLNPSTLSISVAPASQTQKEPEHTQARRSLQVDDGPIPFQTTSSDTSSIFSPPPFPAQAKAVDFSGQEGAHEKAESGAAKANPAKVNMTTPGHHKELELELELELEPLKTKECQFGSRLQTSTLPTAP